MGKADGSSGFGNLDRPMTAMLGRSQLVRRSHTAAEGWRLRLEEIFLHHLPDVSATTMQDGTRGIERHSDCGFDLHEWRHDKLHRVDVHVQKRRSRLGQPVLDRGVQFVRMRNGLPPKAQRARNTGEIRILQLREGIEHAFGLLLDLDKAKLAVVIDSNLDGQFL